mmetsp:Transcript_3350/g.10214  ORF Transcript_3350/g.10214 Transcript_3350/m.10214 type:complete len:244 (+) Transcript_3350:1379-2110(+)
MRCSDDLAADLSSDLSGASVSPSPPLRTAVMPSKPLGVSAGADDLGLVEPPCATLMVAAGLGGGAATLAAADALREPSPLSLEPELLAEPDSATWRSSSFLKSSMVPGKVETVPSSQSQISSATCEMRRMSWDTTHTPPSKLLIASASASMVSGSSALVGSSKKMMCGRLSAIMAKQMRERWPSLSCEIFIVWAVPVIPKRPTMERILLTLLTSPVMRSLGNFSCINSIGDLSNGSWSTVCCW